jgi:hypothetical protein
MLAIRPHGTLPRRIAPIRSSIVSAMHRRSGRLARTTVSGASDAPPAFSMPSVVLFTTAACALLVALTVFFSWRPSRATPLPHLPSSTASSALPPPPPPFSVAIVICG